MANTVGKAKFAHAQFNQWHFELRLKGNFAASYIVAKLLSCGLASAGASFEDLGAPLFLLGPI